MFYLRIMRTLYPNMKITKKKYFCHFSLFIRFPISNSMNVWWGRYIHCGVLYTLFNISETNFFLKLTYLFNPRAIWIFMEKNKCESVNIVDKETYVAICPNIISEHKCWITKNGDLWSGYCQGVSVGYPFKITTSDLK